MSRRENEFRIRPGRSRDAGKGSAKKVQRLAVQVKRAASRSGYTRSAPSGKSRGGGTGRNGRGRHALASIRKVSGQRRVTVMARVVRHKGAHFRAAPLGRHIAYLERDGVTRDGRDASMFDSSSDDANRDAFADACKDDRHHFRFIVSPEDAGEMEDLRTFTRELMGDVARDLDTRLEWVAVDHWNTDNPHIHILVRGVADDGTDLVIDRDYVSAGIRARAEERVTLELGLRSEQEIETALAREVDAERWTSLDRRLAGIAQENAGLVDLRPDPAGDEPINQLLKGRAARLETLGLAVSEGPAVWTMASDAETVLRDLSVRGDIIKTVHRSMARGNFDPSRIAIHPEGSGDQIIGRLVERGLHDELTGSAYAVIDGTDGQIHHLRFDTIELTGDSAPGSIVELRSWEDRGGASRLSLSTRSDFALPDQIKARGATWLDRQLVAREPLPLGNGFGREVKAALTARASFLEAEGMGVTKGNRFQPNAGLIETLRARDLGAAAQSIEARTGQTLSRPPSGEQLSGTYRERVTLSSGRFAMIDDGLGFQLVPWRPALDRYLGKTVTGTVGTGGTIEWSFGKQRGIGL